ncbi:SAM-dependent methyltransferase [Microvirga massiliensis]|uniref:SAM-dependent methyltransferase n=1 Tax=Microvirga massiliensis TaxID=1033741 RepID=UPI000660E734|nr:SAM-dependent methyltransferase [Microvirga massiliensis]
MTAKTRRRRPADEQSRTTAKERLRCDIAIVGLGIAGLHQLTRQVEETIRRCTQVFVADTGTGMVEYLKSLGPDVVDLSTPDEARKHRVLSYRRMATEVVAAATAHAPVCFATYGHPTMFCYPTTLIQRAAIVLDLKVEVLPGISFLDTLLCDLGVDPGFDGLQLYEATDLLVRRRPLQPDVACIITQAPMVANPYSHPGERKLESLRLLQDYLLAFYPPSHEVVLATSAPHPLLEPLIQPIALGALAAALLPSTQLGTLFIPPTVHRPVADEALADRMRLVPLTDRVPPRRPNRPPIGPEPP